MAEGGILINKRLIEKIEKKRKKLNKYNLNEQTQELLRLSQELDELILEYTQKKLNKK